MSSRKILVVALISAVGGGAVGALVVGSPEPAGGGRATESLRTEIRTLREHVEAAQAAPGRPRRDLEAAAQRDPDPGAAGARSRPAAVTRSRGVTPAASARRTGRRTAGRDADEEATR